MVVSVSGGVIGAEPVEEEMGLTRAVLGFGGGGSGVFRPRSIR